MYIMITLRLYGRSDPPTRKQHEQFSSIILRGVSIGMLWFIFFDAQKQI